MKKVFQSNEVAHIWASQSQSEGRGGSVYFQDKNIYSYGRHFCMGRIIDGSTVLLTDRTYSNTTAKHLASVRYSVNHFTTKIYCPHPEEFSFFDNLHVWQRRIKEQLDIISNPRKRQPTKDAAKCELKNIVSNIEVWLKVTKQILNKADKEFKMYFNAAKDEKAGEQLAAKLERKRIKDQKAADKAREEKIKKQTEYLTKWLSGADIQTQWFSDIERVYLRANGKDLETSKGAIVSLKSAKMLFNLIQAGKDIKGHQIDNYTVISLNGVLTIGCHRIEREEINRFASSQGWGQIELH